MPTPASPDTGRVAPRWRRLIVGAGVAVVALAIDQGSKAIALATLETGDRIPLLGDLLGLQLAFNAGSALSFGENATWVFTILAALAALVLPVLMVRASSTSGTVALALIWGGAVGNLIDRLVREPGFGIGRVTDFLAYGDWFIGNLADVLLGTGVILGLLVQLRRTRDR